MADQRTARPVSGEIMTSGRAESHGDLVRSSFVDVVDAEFEVLGEDGIGATPRPEPQAPHGMNMLRGTGETPRK